VRRLAVSLVLLAAFAAPATASAQEKVGIVRPDNEGALSDSELGRQLYAGNCSSCHGSNGEGVVGEPAEGAGDIQALGPPLRGAGEGTVDFYLRTGYMPLPDPTQVPHRTRVLFNEREIRALVAYVGSFGSGLPIPEPQPGNGRVSEGLRLFTEHCAGCHQVVAAGGYVTDVRVPPLSQATARQIAQAVRIGPYVMPRFSDKAISDEELDSIVAYVQAAQHPHDEGGWGIGHIGPVPEGMVAWLLGGSLLVLLCAVIGKRIKQ